MERLFIRLTKRILGPVRQARTRLSSARDLLIFLVPFGAYCYAVHYIGMEKAPPGAAASVLTLQRWGQVPDDLVALARDHPGALRAADYRKAVHATLTECVSFAGKIHKTYGRLESETCNLAAREAAWLH